MLRFALSRFAQALLVMAIVSLGSFFLVTFIGDPVENMLGQEATADEKAALRLELGLERPAIMRFLSFVGLLLEGNLGVSYQFGRPVVDLFLERAPQLLSSSSSRP